MRKQTATSRAAGWIEHFRDKGFRIHAQKFRGLIQVTKEKITSPFVLTILLLV